MKNGRIVLIRHADFFKPVSGAYYGQSDLPLTSEGEEQARALSELLPLQEPGIERVVTSDLVRARRTAQLALPGCSASEICALREMSFGEWEGRRYSEIKDDPAFAAFAGGGAAPGGESESDFAARVIAGLDGLLAGYDGTLAIVAHAGPIRHMLAHLLELDASQSWRFRVDTASVSTVTVTEGYAYLSALNVRPTALFRQRRA